MNPCPCGMGSKGCTCPPRLVEAYKRRVSGPILDRIDLSISVEKVDYKRLSQSNQIYHEESSQDVLNRVRKARQIQYNRYDGKSLLNSELGPKDIEKYANLNSESREHIEKVSEKMNISARAFHRIIKVSRTIADLEESSEIKPNHIFEALQYRQSI
jgi:magnesium chelatase family protein